MRTRMVPFERMLPRLKRIVRQVASELGKDVEFVVGNAEGEMDRNVLERMVAPLEHMLRNAVDHGLESAEVRLAAGKPEQGRITLDLTHEGGDIVFDMRDDGAGVPLEAVRRKAIKRGLLAPERRDQRPRRVAVHPAAGVFHRRKDHPDFRARRGHGRGARRSAPAWRLDDHRLDAGAGRAFPHSSAVHRVGQPRVDGAVRATINTRSRSTPSKASCGCCPMSWKGTYQQDPPRYQYAGQRYELCYLGDLLQTVARPKLLGQYQPLPVLLVHCNERRVAVQVDAMAGTREIVVKSLGPQFAGVQGLSGATILGDGRVVLILDLLAHIRAMQARVAASRPTRRRSSATRKNRCW